MLDQLSARTKLWRSEESVQFDWQSPIGPHLRPLTDRPARGMFLLRDMTTARS